MTFRVIPWPQTPLPIFVTFVYFVVNRRAPAPLANFATLRDTTAPDHFFIGGNTTGNPLDNALTIILGVNTVTSFSAATFFPGP